MVFDFDLGTTVLDHPDRATTRTILDGITDAALDGWVGRSIPRLLRRSGFTDVEVRPRVVLSNHSFFLYVVRRPLAQLVRDGVVGARAALGWLRALEERDRDGDFLAGSVGFSVSALRA